MNKSVTIMPCLDMQNGRVVKGVHFVDIKDAGDPVQCAQAYCRAGADELALLDITATVEGRATMLDVVRRVAEVTTVPFTVGGGISDVASAEAVLLFRSLETDTTHLSSGRQTGATPDGRHAGEPLSENSSPSRGVAGAGLTAILQSLSSLPLDRCHSGALNLRLSPAAFRGEGGRRALADALWTYFEGGGLQAQLSMVDTATLRAAQACPEAHRDLMVRITGYSAAFVDMTPAAQDEIIRRDELAGH